MLIFFLAIWLDPTRTCSSYSLQNPNEEDTTLRLLVLTQNPKELQKLKVPLKENDLEMWWLYQMQRNKWTDFSPDINYSKFEKVFFFLDFSFLPFFLLPFTFFFPHFFLFLFTYILAEISS